METARELGWMEPAVPVDLQEEAVAVPVKMIPGPRLEGAGEVPQ